MSMSRIYKYNVRSLMRIEPGIEIDVGRFFGNNDLSIRANHPGLIINQDFHLQSCKVEILRSDFGKVFKFVR